MRRTRSFSSLLFYSLLALELLFCVAWFGLTALDKYMVFKEESSTIRQEYVEQKKAEAMAEVDKAVEYVEYQIAQTELVVREEVKKRTEEAVGIAQGLVQSMSGTLPPRELQALVMDALRSYRFNGGRGYFFATRMDGVELLFADRPELEGENLLDVQSSDGAFVIRDMIELVRERGEGFYEYLWTKPGTEGGNHRKVAYVKFFEPFNCFIGTGEYVDEQEERLQEIALGWLVRVRFGDEGYLFGSTLRGDPLFTNGKITRGGPSVWDLTDPGGVKIIQSQIETVQSQGSGFVNYSWPKLTNAAPSPKIAYVRGVPEWGWVVGAGFYADDVDKAIAALKARSLDELWNNALRAGLVFLGLVLMSLVVALFISRKVALQLNRLTKFLSTAAAEKTRIEASSIRFDEFREIAHSVNAMLDNQEAAEHALRESEEKFRSAFDSSPDAVNINRLEDGLYMEINQGFTRLTGYTWDDVRGKTSREIDIWYDLADRERLGKELREHGFCSNLEARFRRKDGSITTALMSARVIELHGVSHILSITRDISDRKQAEEAILKAKTQAEEANRSKSTFLANMSHEIRTPINGIMGMLQLLQSTPVNDEQKEYLSLALQSSQRLTRLLSDILDLARVEAGKMEVALQEFVLRDAIHSMTQLLTPLANEKNLDFLTVLSPEIPEILKGDPVRLQQVLTNLVGNAIKFTNEGHVQVEVQVLATRPDGRIPVLFSISDTGVGISEEELEKLFSPFSQVSEGYARKHQGAGLGLSICKRLVELLDGHISIESEPSVGTTVHFVLPFTPASQEGEAEEPAAIPLKSSGVALSILVAEDDQVSSIAIALMLEKLGHRVATVQNGEEALEALQTGTFDLVLMDVQMPVMDGVEATRRIREGEAGRDKASIPIIALTAYAMAGDKERLLEAGMDGYVSKPAKQDRIREEINKAVRHGNNRNTAAPGES